MKHSITRVIVLSFITCFISYASPATEIESPTAATNQQRDYAPDYAYLPDQDTYHYKASTTEIEPPIVVVIASYNNEKWSENTLDSIFTQEYSNFRVIIVDDCSSDNNAQVIQQYIDRHGLAGRTTFIRNDKRHRKLFNLYRVLYDCDDDEIAVMVDGDDSLAHSNVLKQISMAYINANAHKEDIWFTYGQYRNVPASQAIQWGFKEMGYCRAVPKHIQKKQAYRYYSFIYMHPRSFKGWLFKLVKLEDLISDKVEGYEGDFYPAANDVAMYFPMVEMAHTHIKFIPEILYIRNLYSDIVGFKVDKRIQTASSREIRKKSRYSPLFQPKKNRLDWTKTAQADIFLLCNSSLSNIEKTLQNIELQIGRIGTIHVFFQNSTENKNICRTITKHFPDVIFIPYDNTGNKSLKNRLLNNLNLSKTEYVAVLTDTCSIIEPFNLSDSIYWLERSYGYRFYLNRDSTHTGVPRFIGLTDTVCAWKTNPGADKWRNININEDTFVSKKTVLLGEIKKTHFDSVSNFFKEMQTAAISSVRLGLFFTQKKTASLA